VQPPSQHGVDRQSQVERLEHQQRGVMHALQLGRFDHP
jgi:hypothetical protein